MLAALYRKSQSLVIPIHWAYRSSRLSRSDGSGRSTIKLIDNRLHYYRSGTESIGDVRGAFRKFCPSLKLELTMLFSA
jgi:hypothetical protein